MTTPAATTSVDPIATASRVRRIWRLSWPVVISQSLVNAVGLIDVAMLGRVGTATLAAVGYATQFYFIVSSVLTAIGAACVALMARAIGASDTRGAREAFAATLTVCLGLAALVTTIAVSLPEQVLALVDVPPEVVSLAVPYFRLTLSVPLLAAVYLAHEHAFRAHGDTRTPLAIALVITAVKLVANWLLIFGELGLPELGLVGAGLSTALAQLVGVVLFRWRSMRAPTDALHLDRQAFAALRERVPQVLRVAWPAVGEHSVMHLALMLYFKFLGQYGIAVVAAYNVGVRLLSFSWMPGIGLSVAAATLVGQSLGAEDVRGATRTGAQAAKLSLGISFTLGAVFVALRAPLAELFTEDPAVLARLDLFLLLLGIAQPFLGLHFTLGGVLRGAGDTLTPLYTTLIGNWVLRVPLAYLFTRLLSLDVAWVWSIMIVDHVVRASLLTWAFRRGRWQHALASRPAPPHVGTAPRATAAVVRGRGHGPLS